jgi:hypothetical protein
MKCGKIFKDIVNHHPGIASFYLQPKLRIKFKEDVGLTRSTK